MDDVKAPEPAEVVEPEVSSSTGETKPNPAPTDPNDPEYGTRPNGGGR